MAAGSKRRHVVVPRDLRPLKALALQHGWTIEYTKGKHTKWTSPQGKTAIAAGTGGEGRGTANFIATLKRMGLPVQRQGEG